MNDPKRSRSVVRPRIIRFRDAPAYCGMDRNRFNAEVRPQLTEIPIGRQGVGFDRHEIDQWLDAYVSRNGRPARVKGVTSWDANEYPASLSEEAVGMSTSKSSGGEFAKALALLSSKKRSGISHD
jgi:predicted DNA-binding transcriptional regulator AlpA